MSAAVGGVVGMAVGAVAGYFGSRAVWKHADIGVTGGAAAAGALIGAAIFAGPVSAAQFTPPGTVPPK